MSDMFYKYDNEIKAPVKRASGKAPMIISLSIAPEWLTNIKGDLLGIKVPANTDFKLYISVEIEEDSRKTDKYLDNSTIYCEFLSKDLETALTKTAVKYYTGILEISVSASELPADNYYIKVTSSTSVPSEEPKEEMPEEPDLVISDPIDFEVPLACPYICPICGGCTQETCTKEKEEPEEEPSHDDYINIQQLSLDLSDVEAVEIPEEIEGEESNPEFVCEYCTHKCTCVNAAPDIPGELPEEPASTEIIENPVFDNNIHYYWWGCDHNPVKLPSTDTDEINSETGDSDDEFIAEKLTLIETLLFFSTDFILSIN